MPTKPLTTLDFRDPEEVSIVDEAANNRKFPIWKNKELSMDVKEVIQAVMDQEIGDEKGLEEWVVKAKLSEKAAGAVKAAFRILSGFKEELPGDVMSKLAGLAGMSGPPTPPPAPVAKKDEPEPEPKKEPIAKALEGLPVEVRKALDDERAASDLKIKALEDNAVKITKDLEDEKDARDLAEWTEKSKTELSHYPGSGVAEVAKSLQEMHKADPRLAAKMYIGMKASSDALKASEVLKSAGKNAGKVAGGSAWEEIEKMAAGIVEKSSDTAMTQAQAVSHVLGTEQGKALYSRYEDEKGV